MHPKGAFFCGMPPFSNQYVDLVPAQMRMGQDWYKGTADAIYQNLNLIYDEMPSLVCVFGGDHIYKMDVSQMIDYHKMQSADLSIAAIPVPVHQASDFGIIEVDSMYRVTGWQEKPKNPKEMPGRPGYALASMGNYVFNRDVLVHELLEDAANEDSQHDFGKNVISAMEQMRQVRRVQRRNVVGSRHFTGLVLQRPVGCIRNKKQQGQRA